MSAAIPICVDCGHPIDSGWMEGAGDGTGRRFRHRQSPVGVGCVPAWVEKLYLDLWMLDSGTPRPQER